MKLTKTIFLSIAFASSALFLSCEEKKEETKTGDDGGVTTESKADTPDSLTDELAGTLNELADVFTSVKDTDTAKAAVDKIDTLGGKFEEIAGRLDKLEEPSDETKKELEAKMDKVAEELEAKMNPFMKTVMGDQEIAQIIMPAMQGFGERMQKLDPIFERFGKKK